MDALELITHDTNGNYSNRSEYAIINIDLQQNIKMNSLPKATTIEEVINLINPNVLEKIPDDRLTEIAENILLFERYFRGEVFLRPEELTATRFYNPIADEITQIDYKEESYKI